MSTTTVILAPTTAQAYSIPFALNENATVTTLIISGTFVGSESASLQILDPISNTWAPAYINNVNPILNSTNNMLDIYSSWGQYRLNKSATTNAVGASVRHTPQTY